MVTDAVIRMSGKGLGPSADVALLNEALDENIVKALQTARQCKSDMLTPAEHHHYGRRRAWNLGREVSRSR
jgi:hypothetical protein